MAASLRNKTILITGGTGSFGHVFVRKLLKTPVKEIRIFSRDEDKQEKMRYEFQNSPKLKFFIGDIRDKDSIKAALKSVDFVIHAAALKHIPIYESNPWEVIKTNVFGAKNVVEASQEVGVKRLVGISTDKAAEPVNVMGMTKALQEKIFLAANIDQTSKTIVSVVRYGNVLGSRGSVLPLFLKQIENKRPLTITHPEMTRFLLTLDQAVDLVNTALEKSLGGEIFVPRLESHRIVDLAAAVSELSGKTKVQKVGIRTGEKLHETMISPTESVRSSETKDYFVILPQFNSLRAFRYYKLGKNKEPFRYSSDSEDLLSVSDLKQILIKEGFFEDGKKAN